MALSSKYIQFTKATGTGVQTVSTVGFRGKAIFLWTTFQTALGGTTSALLSLGMSDGILQSCRFVNHPGAEATTTGAQDEQTDYFIRKVSATSGATPTVQVAGIFTGFTDDGFTINFTTNDGSAAICHAVILGGDIEAQFSHVKMDCAAGESIDVTDIAFRPSAYIVMGGAADEFGGGDYSVGAPYGSIHGFGFSNASDNVSGWTLGISGGVADTYRGQMLSKVASVRAVTGSPALALMDARITANLDNGYTITRDVANAGTEPVQHVMCLKGVQFALGSFTAPLTAIDKVLTVPFEPDLIITQTMGIPSSENTSGMGLTIGSWQRADNESGGTYIGGVDAANPSSYRRGTFEDLIIEHRNPSTGTVTIAAAVDDTDDVSVTFGFTTVTGNADEILYMCLAASETVRGSFVAGENTTVRGSRAAAFGLDGNTNVHDEEGKLKVFGKFEATDDSVFRGNLEVDGDLTVAGSSPIGSGAGGAVAFIEEQSPSGTGTLTFSNLGAYTHLELRWNARGDEAAISSTLGMRFNGDTGANYDSERMQAFGSTATATEGLAATSANIGTVTAASGTGAGMSSSGVISILDYLGTVFQKNGIAIAAIHRATSTGNTGQQTLGFAWRNTAAISSITILLSGGNFVAGSKFSLYGVGRAGNGGGGQDESVVAASSESVSNNTLQDDNELLLPVIANAVYIVELVCFFTTGTSTTPDVQAGFTCPAGATMLYSVVGYSTTATTNEGLALTSNQLADTTPTGPNTRGVLSTATTGTSPYILKGVLRMSSVGGTLQFQFAQSVSTGGTPLVREANSYLRITKVQGSSVENVIITPGTVAALPAAAVPGRIYLPTDGMQLYRDTGSVWQPWGPLFPLTLPVSGDFAWVNQGGASVDVTYGGVHLIAPAASAFNVRLRKKTAPSTPYTITAAFLLAPISLNYQTVGICFRQSSDGKIHAMGISTGTAAVEINSAKYTSATVFSAVYSSRSIAGWSGIVFLRIADNGTNRICSFSADGQHFTQFHSIGRTDFLTADEVGFFCNDETNVYDLGATLLSWKQA